MVRAIIDCGRAARLACVRLDRRWFGPRRLDVVLLTMIVTLLLHTEQDWDIAMATAIAAVAGLLIPQVRRSGVVWLLIAAMLAYAYIGNGLNRWIINHKYLYMYWCLAMGLSLLTVAPLRYLSRNGRLLIGGCFAFATLWKVIAPEFPGGGFFHFTLLTDERFKSMAMLAGGLSEEQWLANARAFQDIRGLFADPSSVEFIANPRLVVLARFMAVWTILVEGLIALCYLAPASTRLHRLRHLPLLLFVITTYPIATVTGFARLLLVMAVANCGSRESATRLLYLVIFILIPLMEFPFGRYILRVLSLLGV